MVTATWKFYNYNADASKVAEEIFSIGETATPAQIVERARDESSELHKCFEWNDTVAAEKYRICQARQVVRNLVFKQSEREQDKPPLRILHRTSSGDGYKNITYIMQNKDEYQNLLAQAYAEMSAFQKRFHSLSELEDVMEAIGNHI